MNLQVVKDDSSAASHGDSYVISLQTVGRQGPLGVPAIQYVLLILQYLLASSVVKSEQEVNSTH